MLYYDPTRVCISLLLLLSLCIIIIDIIISSSIIIFSCSVGASIWWHKIKRNRSFMENMYCHSNTHTHTYTHTHTHTHTHKTHIQNTPTHNKKHNKQQQPFKLPNKLHTRPQRQPFNDIFPDLLHQLSTLVCSCGRHYRADSVRLPRPSLIIDNSPTERTITPVSSQSYFQPQSQE